MDVKKFLGGDASEEATAMGEGLLQRTKVQVTGYMIEDKDGNSVDPETVTKHMKENDGSPADLKDVHEWTHVFSVRHLDNANDPNTAANLMDYGEKDK